MKQKSWVVVIIVFFLNFALGLTLEEVQQKLAKAEVVRSQFIQERYITGMAKPLTSKGLIIISKEYGLYWQQGKPFDLTLVLTKNRMVQQLGNGKKEIVTASQNPQLFQFNQLLFSLFHMDQKTLTENFSVKFNVKEKGAWAIELTPKKLPINKIFKTIFLSGHEFIDKVRLEDQQGDLTEIYFTEHNSNPLSDQDVQKFAL